MSWIVAFGLALGALALVVRLAAGGRAIWVPVAAALAIGFAGFAVQVRPGISAAPRPQDDPAKRSGAELVAARRVLAPEGSPTPDRWTVIADALARNGQFRDAAGVVLGAVEANPRNADAWLALGNDLVAHADGALTPAAQFAYARAAEADPAHPGPPFFLGLALASQGRSNEGRAQWAALLARAPRDAPWRRDLELRLARLDAVIAAQPKPRFEP